MLSPIGKRFFFSILFFFCSCFFYFFVWLFCFIFFLMSIIIAIVSIILFFFFFCSRHPADFFLPRHPEDIFFSWERQKTTKHFHPGNHDWKCTVEVCVYIHILAHSIRSFGFISLYGHLSAIKRSGSVRSPLWVGWGALRRFKRDGGAIFRLNRCSK